MDSLIDEVETFVECGGNAQTIRNVTKQRQANAIKQRQWIDMVQARSKYADDTDDDEAPIEPVKRKPVRCKGVGAGERVSTKLIR